VEGNRPSPIVDGDASRKVTPQATIAAPGDAQH
jgi:hypothetical protein